MHNFQTLTLPLNTDTARLVAAQFIAELARQRVGFKASTSYDNLELFVTFTGAH